MAIERFDPNSGKSPVCLASKVAKTESLVVWGKNRAITGDSFDIGKSLTKPTKNGGETYFIRTGRYASHMQSAEEGENSLAPSRKGNFLE